MEPMSTSENAPVSYYGDKGMGSGASAALLAGLATKDYYNPMDGVSANGIGCLRSEVAALNGEIKDAECNIRHDVKDSESNIRRDVAKESGDIRADILREGQENMAATKDAECNLSKEILETRHTLAKDILRAEYEAKLGAERTIKEVNANTNHVGERLQDRLDHFERRTETKFDGLSDKLCSFERRVDDKFTHLREEGLEEKVFKLSQDLQTAKLEKLICCGCGNESVKVK